MRENASAALLLGAVVLAPLVNLDDGGAAARVADLLLLGPHV